LGVSVSIISPWGPNNPVRVFDEPEGDPQKHAVIMVYPVTIVAGEPAASGPEFNESKWFPADGLPEIMGFLHKQEAEAAIQAVTGRL